jgi:hypothetical protein
MTVTAYDRKTKSAGAPGAGKSLWRARAVRCHQILAAFGGAALLVWGASGILHPIMTMFGPQPALLFPPQRALDLSAMPPLDETLAQAGIVQAEAVKIIVGENENLLQVTERADAPRRYFRLKDGSEIVDHDRTHALWLANYSMGLRNATVRSVETLTEFDDEYPAVNRLLPVYRIVFDRDDDLTVYIHTETNAVAAVTNAFKSGTQQWFQRLHTWSWMPREAEAARVVLIGALVGALFALAATGTAMLVSIRRKIRAPGVRGWHRIAGYALALPLLMFSTSGLFHLIQHGWEEPLRTLTLSPPIDIAEARFPIGAAWTEISRDLNVNGFSLVKSADGSLLYRLSLAPGAGAALASASEHDHAHPVEHAHGQTHETTMDARAIRNARFDGVEHTGPAVYVRAETGEVWADGDRELALQLGERFTGRSRDEIVSAEIVTRFGPAYDFRNKRLPIWRLDYGPPVNATVFVDTATGVLADKTPDAAKLEQWSFSVLHKWNFLSALGREAQNAVIVATVAGSMALMAGFGLRMDWKRRRAKRS